MKKFLVSLTDDFVKPLNPTSIVLLGMFTVIWGIWIILPFWEVFATAPLFSALLSVAPEWMWGLNAIICGSTTVFGVYSRKYGPLASGTAVVTWHWFVVGLLCFIGDWQNTGGLVYMFLCIWAALTRLNLKLSHKSQIPVHKMFIE